MAPNQTPSFENNAFELSDWGADLKYHDSFFDSDLPIASERSALQDSHAEEIKTTPIFSATVLKRVAGRDRNFFRQHGLMARVLEEYGDKTPKPNPTLPEPAEESDVNDVDAETNNDTLDLGISSVSNHLPDSRLFLNINAPWSAFICGSQGSGKSHTLSCMLESALQPSRLGPLPAPLAGIVFHYDKFSSFGSSQICEAAYLCSSGISVNVLVSATSFHQMKKVYENLQGVSKESAPNVMPLFLKEDQLNVERMMTLMAIEDEGRTALYMEVLCRILRSMALSHPDKPGLDYQEFKRRLDSENFNPAQASMARMRLDLLESFMYLPNASAELDTGPRPYFPTTAKGHQQQRDWQDTQDRHRRAQLGKDTRWSFATGTLTIIDLSSPFVDESTACALFNICLTLFLGGREHDDGVNSSNGNSNEGKGRIIALDEAHKFMTGTSAANDFNESLLSIIRQQRHLAARVIIATQEPTISPALLDLCSMTIVHRFTSPGWLKALSAHLAGVSVARITGSDDDNDGEDNVKRRLGRVFERIVGLQVGEALLFSPSAMMRPVAGEGFEMQKVGLGYVKIRVRKRVTFDGGKSILAA